MTRTVALNLLSGILPLLVMLLHQLKIDVSPLAFLFIVVQVTCWACVVVLLYWNRELMGLAILALIVNVVFWFFALLMIFNRFPSGRESLLLVSLLLVMFVIAEVTTLLLRFGSALVNMREEHLEIRENPRPQFQLSWLFSVSAFAAVVTMLCVVMERLNHGSSWIRALEFLQIGCWLAIAESMLIPQIRWKSSALLVLVLGTVWYIYLSQQRFAVIPFLGIWLPTQLMIIVIPLLYRWAGWRIVPRELAEHLLHFAMPKEIPRP